MNTSQPRFDYFIEDMIGAMKQLLHYTEGIDYNSFASNPMLRDAVVRNFEVIGECVKHIPFSFQNKHPEIPWALMLELRNFIAHEFFDVDDEILWAIIETDLKKNIEDMQQLKHGLHQH